jgi:hypothetical protein
MMFLWLLAGIGMSLLSLASQWWMVSRLSPVGGKWMPVLFPATFVLRLALCGLLLYVAMRHGLSYALMEFAGLITGRWGLLIILHNRRQAMKVRQP